MYARLISGKVLNRRELAEEYGVTARSVQRDVEDLRCFLAEQSPLQDVVYDRTAQGYRLTGTVPDGLSNSEILAVCKILLESRSMRADEMLPLLDKLITCAVPEESRRSVKALISNEQIHYIPPQHNRQILDGLWELGQAVRNRNVLEIAYTRMKEPKLVRRRVQPVGLMFSEYYFYLTAFLENRTNFENPNDLFPTIYRRLTGTASRKGNSGNGCSSCTAGGWRPYASATPACPWRRCWTGCLPLRSWAGMGTAG